MLNIRSVHTYSRRHGQMRQYVQRADPRRLWATLWALQRHHSVQRGLQQSRRSGQLHARTLRPRMQRDVQLHGHPPDVQLRAEDVRLDLLERAKVL